MSKKSRRQNAASRNNRRTNIDHARTLPRYDAAYLEAWNGDWEDTLQEIIDEPDEKEHHASAGQLRGIPAIGRGVTGCIPGQHPEDCIDRIDKQRGATA